MAQTMTAKQRYLTGLPKHKLPAMRPKTAPNACIPSGGHKRNAQKMGATVSSQEYYRLKREGNWNDGLMVRSACSVVENMRMHQKNEITEWLGQKGAQLHRTQETGKGVFFSMTPDEHKD